MAGPLSRSDLLWSGEHWILYLRRPGDHNNSGSVSLYKTHYSPAGEGVVALIGSEEGSSVAPAIFADNLELADFIVERVVAWRASPFDRDMPIVDATFTRSGDIRSAPQWRMEAENAVAEARWSDIEPAVVMDQPLKAGDVAVTHSLLFFTTAAKITVDCQTVEGVPFVREDWKRAIGRPASSCCFALSETMATTG